MIHRLQSEFHCTVGWSDHSAGNHLAIAAVTVGAKTVERHFTTDKTLYGSDQSSSIEPDQFKEMVTMVRDVEVAVGDGIKKVTEQEVFNAKKLRQHIKEQ